MLLLAAIGGFLFGVWMMFQWGNHRAKYYRKQMKKALILSQEVQEANKILIMKMEEMQSANRARECDGMRHGVLDAITNLSQERLS